MIRRIFSRHTYNGYHLVSYKGEGEDGVVGFFKKLDTKDECGFMADPDTEMPKCPVPGYSWGRPWDNYLYVPSGCQKCIWLFTTAATEYDCQLLAKININPRILVRGGQ